MTTPPEQEPVHEPAPQAANLDTRQQLIDAYKRLVSAGEHPTELDLATAAGLDEAGFHSHFASVDAVGRAAWAQFAERTVARLDTSEAYRSYGARERVLAYSFTFFADAPAERSFIRHTWDRSTLVSDYRTAYQNFVSGVLQEGIALDEVQARFGLDNTYPAWLWSVHCGLIGFWLDDESPDFAETERAIETRHKLPLEFMGRNILDSVWETVAFELEQLKLGRVFDDLRDEARRMSNSATDWFRTK